jgi:hypothetical protein
MCANIKNVICVLYLNNRDTDKLLLLRDKGTQTKMVTSGAPGEGQNLRKKSTVELSSENLTRYIFLKQSKNEIETTFL